MRVLSSPHNFSYDFFIEHLGYVYVVKNVHDPQEQQEQQLSHSKDRSTTFLAVKKQPPDADWAIFFGKSVYQKKKS